MSLPDIQLHLSLSFCWHAGLGYGTRSSPQMKTNNMNLTLLTTNSNFGDEAMGCGGGVSYYSLRFSHTIPRVTNTCNLTDPKLVGYKSMFRSRNFFQGGGGGVHARRPEMDNVFFFYPQLFLQFIEGVQWFDYRENYTFPRIQRGSDIFQGGGGSNFFQGGGGGVLIIIFKETHITCDFLGGSGPQTPPPLWIRTCKIAIKVCFEPCHTRAAPIPCKSEPIFPLTIADRMVGLELKLKLNCK